MFKNLYNWFFLPTVDGALQGLLLAVQGLEKAQAFAEREASIIDADVAAMLQRQELHLVTAKRASTIKEKLAALLDG